MIKFVTGNILGASTDALVNPVNCVGVMGAGLAAEFKGRYTAMFESYVKACKSHQLVPGKVHVYDIGVGKTPRLIINFPTKNHWRERSWMQFIEKGMEDLTRVVKLHKIKSISIPQLGCGLGGLSWREVHPLIEGALSPLKGLEVHIYGVDPNS